MCTTTGNVDLSTEQVQTKTEIAGLLKTMGVRPRKRLGQNFLIDGNLMRRLADAAEIGPDDLVFEVGAGTGGLTDLLLTRARRLIVVEIDPTLYEIVSDRVGRIQDKSSCDATVLNVDVLATKHRLASDVEDALRTVESPSNPTAGVKLVANLPYQVATPLIMNLLVDYPAVYRLCFTVQAEVGERITSRPGCKAYGPLSIVSQSLCSIDVVAKLPPQAFWPQPAVDSVMLRMDVGDSPFSSREELRSFVRFVRGVFDHRRKTLRSGLRYVLDDKTGARVCAQVDATRRPESFSVSEWLAIYRATASHVDTK
jgi:16S rRNA (adenine1518-N6/adenine1519-N6)-dimethyltransferase